MARSWITGPPRSRVPLHTEVRDSSIRPDATHPRLRRRTGSRYLPARGKRPATHSHRPSPARLPGHADSRSATDRVGNCPGVSAVARLRPNDGWHERWLAADERRISVEGEARAETWVDRR